MSTPQNRRLLASFLFVMIIASIVIYAIFFSQTGIQHLSDQGEVIDFTMQNHEGENFTFSDSNGNVRVVSFIYTKCTMGCSTITSKMASMRDKLQDNDQYNQVQFITIDFDYIYDNLTDLKNYANIFLESDDRWQFLLGTKNQTDKVADDYNFVFELDNSTMETNETDNPHSGHEVVYTHPFITYFVDQNGHMRGQKGGLDWTLESGIEIIEFLLEE